MKINFSFSKHLSFVFALFLLIGIQTNANAQITVSNFTGCDITVFVGQFDVNTLLPCDLCPINPPVPILIPNGDTVPIFGQDICGETFGWLRWTIAGSGFGVTSNPGLVLPFPCAGNFSAAFCGAFTPTQAFWLSSGPGPVEVFIF